MDSQSFYNAQQQVLGFRQPITSVGHSTESAYGNANAQQQRGRFTRVERRKFTKEKKAHFQGGQFIRKTNRKMETKATPTATSNVNTIDDVIAALLVLRNNKGGNREVQGALNQATKTLEQRITRDPPKKTEPSAKKLEKIQKRKEIRAERRKTKLALRAQQESEAQAKETTSYEAAVVPAALIAPAASEQQQLRDPEIDAINFDEL